MSAMNISPDRQTFEIASTQLRMEAAFVEKDWFATQIIAIIAGLRREGFEVIFSGGTALSKAHNLLQRFSEDVDFRVLAAPSLHNRKALSAFKNSVIEALRSNGFAIKEEQVKARDQNRFIAIDLDYESHFLRPDALRPHIQIEMTARDIQLPPIYLPVASFISGLAKHPPEVIRMGCIDPVESAADKLSALAWRIPDRIRGDKYDDPAIVRHIHDLAMLKDRALTHPRFCELVSASMQEDNARAKNDPTLEGMPMADKLRRMLTILESDKEYLQEYDRFVKSVSYAPEGVAPSFEKAMETVKLLIRKLHEADA